MKRKKVAYQKLHPSRHPSAQLRGAATATVCPNAPSGVNPVFLWQWLTDKYLVVGPSWVGDW